MSEPPQRTARDSAGAAWRLLPPATASDVEHLARTQALLESVGAGRAPRTISFERWDRPALILGTSQRGSDIDVQACRRRGISVARRLAGGKAVFATPDYLSFTIVAPARDALVRGDVLAPYQQLGAPVVAALESLGFAASLLSVPSAREAQAGASASVFCYGGLSPYEVMVGTRKLVGVAQVRRFGGIAYVGGLYRVLDATSHAALMAGDGPTRAAEARRLIGSTADLVALGAPGLFERIPEAIVAALAACYGLPIEHGGLLPGERERQAELVREQYATAAWTWRR